MNSNTLLAVITSIFTCDEKTFSVHKADFRIDSSFESGISVGGGGGGRSVLC